jgi:hypothetical protein
VAVGLPQAGSHPERKEIARYLLSRASFLPPDAPTPGHPTPIKQVEFPDGLAPLPAPIEPQPDPDAPLPAADVVVITWTADEAQALAHVLTPGFSPAQTVKHCWYPYKRNFAAYEPQIRGGAPARQSGRLGSYLPVTLAGKTVLCMKSELHLNQDGISSKQVEGTATLPVKDFFKQIINEAKPSLFLTIGTAGSVTDAFKLGDVVVTRAARFWLGQEFRNEPYNGNTYRSEWTIPTGRFEQAETMMAAFNEYLAQPPVGVPSPQYPASAMIPPPGGDSPKIRLDGRDMDAFHPILTTDWFEYGTTANRLDRWGAGVEMGDAALGLAIHELTTNQRPHWAIVRNMSDPVINGELPAKEFHLNEQTTWAVGFYTAYGVYTSIIGAITTWAIITGLD